MNCAICERETQSPALTIHDQPVCKQCASRIQERVAKVEARQERLQRRADRLHDEAEAGLKRAGDRWRMIPMGQPMMPDHYSYKRDRNFRGKTARMEERAFETLKRARQASRRAEAATENRSISSDDPAAVLKLQAKLEGLEAEQERMKAINKTARKLSRNSTLDMAGKVTALAEAHQLAPTIAADLLIPEYGKIGYPSYQLRNNGAEIRRLHQRIEILKRQAVELAQAEDADSAITREATDLPGVDIERDIEDNRLRLYFPGKPSEDIRRILKSRGFRWSSSNGAWQRQLNNGAEWAAERALKQIAPLWEDPDEAR